MDPDKPGQVWMGSVMTTVQDGTTGIEAFAADLRELRRTAGQPSYAELGRRTGLPRSTLHDGLRGQRLPSLELTLAVVGALGGDEAAWRERWVRLRGTLDRDADPVATTSAAGAAGRGRRWWRSRRVLVLAAVVLLVVAGGVTAAVVWTRHGPCTPVRQYVARSGGAVLDSDGRVIGQTRAGDTIEVRSLSHGRYAHRYYGTDLRTGQRGYLDEARLAFRAERCA
jgi:DNA-binding phage protein